MGGDIGACPLSNAKVDERWELLEAFLRWWEESCNVMTSFASYLVQLVARSVQIVHERPDIYVGFGTIVAVFVLYVLYQKIRFLQTMRHGSKTARIASAALKALREDDPHAYPPTRHQWTTGLDEEPTAPLLCGACLNIVDPFGVGQSLRHCAVCGIVVHESCARHIEKTCRPLSVNSDHPEHFWMVSGTSFVITADWGDIAQMQRASANCVYCGRAAGGFASTSGVEAVWQCGCCMSTTHVSCFCAAHAEYERVRACLPDSLKSERNEDRGSFSKTRAKKFHRVPSSLSIGSISSDKLERIDYCSMGPLS